MDFPPVPDAVERNLLTEDIVTHPVRPDLKAPSADAFALELFDLRRWAKWVRLEALDGFEDPLLRRDSQSFEVALEAGGEAYSEAG